MSKPSSAAAAPSLPPAITASRKNKMAKLVTAKMIQKYGVPVNPDSPPSSLNNHLTQLIRDVFEVMSSVADVKPNDLKAIETKCKALKTGYDRASVKEGQGDFKAKNPSKSLKTLKIEEDKKRFQAPVFLKNDWVIMDTFDAVEAEKAQALEKVQAHEKKKEVRRTLDVQVAAKESILKIEKAREMDFLRKQNGVMEQWNYEQTLAGTMGHDKMIKDRGTSDEQCRLNKEKRDGLRMREKAQEVKDIDICKKELRKEEEERIRRIKEMHSNNVHNMAAVKLQFGKRDKEEREEKAEDHRLMILMTNMMEEQEKARKEAFQQRSSRYDKFSTKWQESGAGKMQREAELKMERIILRDAEAQEEKDRMREEGDIAKTRKNARMMQSENMAIAGIKAERVRVETENDRIYSNGIRMAGEAYVAGGWERDRDIKLKGLMYGKQLAAQQAEMERREQKVEMAEAERMMNFQKIKKIAEDPTIIKEIQDKMFVKRPMKESAKFKYLSNLPGFSIPGASEN